MERLKEQKEIKKTTNRAKRTVKRQTKKNSTQSVINGMKGLTFSELDTVIAQALRFRKEKMGNEELRLIKEREEIEMQIKKLKEMDETLNEY